MLQKKNVYFKFFILLLLSVFMMGCNLFLPDTGDTGGSGAGVGTGSFTYPGGSGTFEGGELENDGTGGTTGQFHTWGIYLRDDSLMFDSATTEYSGIGDVVIFTVITDSTTDLDTGTYTFDATSPSSQTSSGVFDTADVYIDYDADAEDYTLNLKATGGTLTVTSAGPDYNLSFNITTASGNVTGTYEGSLEKFND